MYPLDIRVCPAALLETDRVQALPLGFSRANKLPTFHLFHCTVQRQHSRGFLVHFPSAHVQMIMRLFVSPDEVRWMNLIDPLRAEILSIVKETWQQEDPH